MRESDARYSMLMMKILVTFVTLMNLVISALHTGSARRKSIDSVAAKSFFISRL